MPYDSLITRSDAAALIPEEVSAALLKSLTASSAALSLFTRIPVSRAQVRLPILSALPSAYFVAADTGLKQTTEAAWTNRYLNVEEIAAILPVPEAVLDDTDYDIWGSISPLLEAAIARTLDAAVFFGTNAPVSWTDADIVGTAAGKNPARIYERGTSSAAAGGIAEDFNQLFGLVETEGFVPSAVLASPALRTVLRSARDTTGQPLVDVGLSSILGATLRTDALTGLWPAAATAEALVLDASQGVVGVRQDVTYKVLDQAVLTNSDGDVTLNLAQQDLIALRVVFRAGFAVANAPNYADSDINSTSRYPFAVLRNATP